MTASDREFDVVVWGGASKTMTSTPTAVGAEVAEQLTSNTRQFRITARRPDGKKGDFGKVNVGVVSKVLGSIRLE